MGYTTTFATLVALAVSMEVYRGFFMLTKRKIIVVIGIIVAILITFYTGVFGLSPMV